nr:alpha/beta-type small acid-soluble spore protein [bacterium]
MMSSNKPVVPQAQEALNKMKYEVAQSLNVNLKQGYNGDLTAKENGSVGGEMVKRLLEQYANSNAR